MQLRNEGDRQPAPVLRGKAQELSLEIQKWDGMQAVTHWQLEIQGRLMELSSTWTTESLGTSI